MARDASSELRTSDAATQDANAGGAEASGGSAAAGDQTEGQGTQLLSSVALGPSVNGFATTSDPDLVLPETASTYSSRVEWAPRDTQKLGVNKNRKANKQLTGKE